MAVSAEVLEYVKEYNGIPQAVTVYDTTFTGWIEAGQEDLRARGVPESLITANNPRVLVALAAYCRGLYLAFIGGNVADMTAYEKMVHFLVFRMQTETGGTWDAEDEG